MDIRFLYITAKDKDEAARIGKTLVTEKLAACANILPKMNSIYFWEGELVEDEEAVLILKTKAGLVEQAMERVKSLHSYKVPCVMSIPLEKGNPAYVQWLHSCCR